MVIDDGVVIKLNASGQTILGGGRLVHEIRTPGLAGTTYGQDKRSRKKKWVRSRRSKGLEAGGPGYKQRRVVTVRFTEADLDAYCRREKARCRKATVGGGRRGDLEGPRVH